MTCITVELANPLLNQALAIVTRCVNKQESSPLQGNFATESYALDDCLRCAAMLTHRGSMLPTSFQPIS
ncbi:hypothetical protein Q31a_08810 [Aureliella helgolandensis]|uniref:Uncharacterized protein n=1 Tax=Aureliella helgolandensis TaxID=2527968 RepID=A0A518G226_9BACT|nr:hypothetical protein Q31a_08810 [Aureliella helgolandensis]